MASAVRKTNVNAPRSKETGPTRLRDRTSVTMKVLKLKDEVRKLDDNFLLYLYEMVITQLLEPFSVDERQAILRSFEESWERARIGTASVGCLRRPACHLRPGRIRAVDADACGYLQWRAAPGAASGGVR